MRNEGLCAISRKLHHLKNVSMGSSGFKIYEGMFFRLANSWGEYLSFTGRVPQKEQFEFYQSLRHAKITNCKANEGQNDGNETKTDLDSAVNSVSCDLSSRWENYFRSPYWRSTTDSDTFVDSGKGKRNRMNQSETDIDENINVNNS